MCRLSIEREKRETIERKKRETTEKKKGDLWPDGVIGVETEHGVALMNDLVQSCLG